MPLLILYKCPLTLFGRMAMMIQNLSKIDKPKIKGRTGMYAYRDNNYVTYTKS